MSKKKGAGRQAECFLAGGLTNDLMHELEVAAETIAEGRTEAAKRSIARAQARVQDLAARLPEASDDASAVRKGLAGVGEKADRPGGMAGDSKKDLEGELARIRERAKKVVEAASKRCER